MKPIILITVILTLAVAAEAFADTPEYVCKRTTEKIVIDGILDEADWQAAASAGDFVFPWWTGGEKEQTEAKLMWDDTYLYLSFRCDDKHIWADHYNTNEATYNDDCVELFWNPSPDKQDNYYQFEINCIGNLLSVLHKVRSTIMLPHVAQTIQGTVSTSTPGSSPQPRRKPATCGGSASTAAAGRPTPSTASGARHGPTSRASTSRRISGGWSSRRRECGRRETRKPFRMMNGSPGVPLRGVTTIISQNAVTSLCNVYTQQAVL